MHWAARSPLRRPASTASRRSLTVAVRRRGVAFGVQPSPVLLASEITADVWFLVVAAAVSVGLAVASYEVCCAAIL